jgi:serine/threonine-protein kinase RsbW
MHGTGLLACEGRKAGQGSRLERTLARVFQRHFDCDRNGIASAADDLAAWLEKEAPPSQAALLASLALDELATNSLKYGSEEGRLVRILYTCELRPDAIRIRIEDDGRPFDPTAAPQPDATLPLDAQTIGGRGIALLRALSSSFRYERREGQNCVTLESPALPGGHSRRKPV